MQRIGLIFISVIFALSLMLVVVAEVEQHHRVRHHAKHHKRSHKKSHHHTSIEESPNDHQKRTLPPNIWALLTSTSNESRNKAANGDDDVGPKYNIDVTNHEMENGISNEMDFASIEHESNEKVSANCPKCKQNSVKMSADELSRLRIEYVKNQILHKLRMTERPAQVSKDFLPVPIQEGYTIHRDADEETEDYLNRHLDDYFAKTTQKIIFLNRESQKCKSHESKDYPSACFSFQIPSDVDVSTVESAQLWVYKEPNSLDYTMNQTFLLSEVGHWGSNKNFTKSKPVAIREIDQSTEGWEKIDIAWPVKNWVEFHDLSHVIQIACETCSSSQIPISLGNDRKPFIVIDTFPQRTVNRKQRSANCGPGSTECCRDSLYISFASIGWNDWIIHPSGYNAYFCRGSCNRVASITKAGTHHSTVLSSLRHRDAKDQKKLELVPCCTATRYTSLQIFYLDSNQTATQATLPNMIVESCGCM